MTALYEVELVAPPGESGQVRLGELRIRYEPPGAERGEATERALPLTGRVFPQFAEASVDTRVAVVAGGFASVLNGAREPSLALLEDLLPIRPEYRDQDEALLHAIRRARGAGR